MKRFLSLLLVLGLAACSSISPIGGSDSNESSKLSDFLNKIQTVTVDDANAALADVHAHGDVDLAALQCLPAIVSFIQSSPIAPTAPSIKGVLSANQVKRDVVLGGVTRNGPFQIALRQLHVACAAYVGDEVRFAAEFAAMIGATRGAGAIGAPLAIGPAIPLSALPH